MVKFDRVAEQHPFVLSARGDCEELCDTIGRRIEATPLSLLLLFCPDGATVAPLSGALSARCGERCRVLACSSAGGFAFDGYDDESVIAIAFPAASFAAEAVWLANLRQHMALDWMMSLRNLSETFRITPGQNRFGLLLIDGMSRREELVTATVDATIPDLLVLGGSAGDGLRFENTSLAMDGEARDESAIFCMIATDFAIEEVIFDHFNPVGSPMVVTDADPDNRIIREINAEPAAAEYARLIGLTEAELGPRAFAENPLLTRSGGRHFVRAISGVTAEGGLSLMSGIDIGAILTIGRPESLTRGLRQRMEQIGPAELVLGFDCVLRRIAIEQADEMDTLGSLCRDHRVAGFSTYGEQHGGIHVNQTFVGLAFIAPRSSAEQDGAGDVA
ncbi:FIST C-terminal domain-containing protein [Paracoccus caeni]|uniref:FIST C-terminal domain-containing protein n=1 Tax=Paracoccus caeni TaxID=657651 RepID=A0A934SIE3_9RHOB|nr:FIST N-terminal domain-containing protein [Paracoccus caeni]MBK4218213.1 FIST C-terminal domain-containing protein [Paracoccus caeni]